VAQEEGPELKFQYCKKKKKLKINMLKYMTVYKPVSLASVQVS
jgi:hypothetical protein